MKNKYDSILEDLVQATERFEDVLAQKKDEYIRDSAIQRFEFTFELLWKTMKIYLEEKGIKAYSPKEVFKEAYKDGLIKDENIWFEMIESRNLTSHVYKEETAEMIYKGLSAYLTKIEEVVKEFLKYGK